MYFLSWSTLSLYIHTLNRMSENILKKKIQIILYQELSLGKTYVTFFCTLSYKFEFGIWKKKWQKDLTNLSNQRGEIFFLIPDHWSKGERWHYGQNWSKNAAGFQSQKGTLVRKKNIFGIKYENSCSSRIFSSFIFKTKETNKIQKFQK